MTCSWLSCSCNCHVFIHSFICSVFAFCCFCLCVFCCQQTFKGNYFFSIHCLLNLYFCTDGCVFFGVAVSTCKSALVSCGLAWGMTGKRKSKGWNNWFSARCFVTLTVIMITSLKSGSTVAWLLFFIISFRRCCFSYWRNQLMVYTPWILKFGHACFGGICEKNQWTEAQLNTAWK